MLKWKKILFGSMATVFGIHVASMLTKDREMAYVNVDIRSPKLQRVNGLKAAFLSDLHWIGDGSLSLVVEHLNKRDLDVLLLGGDFADSPMRMRRQLEIIAGVKTKYGVYGVDGNHDVKKLLFDAMKELGMHGLGNKGTHLCDGFYLCGVEDLRMQFPNVIDATRDRKDSDFVLMLSHNPDVVLQQNTQHVDLMLSGHTHGGQVSLFGQFSPALFLISKYGQIFRGGFVKANDQTAMTYVSRGLGWHGPVPRIFARPEVTLLTFYG